MVYYPLHGEGHPRDGRSCSVAGAPVPDGRRAIHLRPPARRDPGLCRGHPEAGRRRPADEPRRNGGRASARTSPPRAFPTTGRSRPPPTPPIGCSGSPGSSGHERHRGSRGLRHRGARRIARPVRGRGRTGLPRADCGRRALPRRVSASPRRPGPRPGADRRRGHRPGRAPPAGGRAGGREGRPRHRGDSHHVRVPRARGLPPAIHRDGREAPRGRRGGRDRQDQHGRVRHGLVHRKQRLPEDAQSLGSRAGPRGIVGRLGGGGRRLHGAPGPRHRYRRLHPPTRRSLRSRGTEADLWAREPIRPRGLRFLPGPGGPIHPRRRRRGSGLLRAVRRGRHGRHERVGGRPRFRRRARSGRRGPARGRSVGVPGAGRRCGRHGRVSPRGRGPPCRRSHRSSTSPCPMPITP